MVPILQEVTPGTQGGGKIVRGRKLRRCKGILWDYKEDRQYAEESTSPWGRATYCGSLFPEKIVQMTKGKLSYQFCQTLDNNDMRKVRHQTFQVGA